MGTLLATWPITRCPGESIPEEDLYLLAFSLSRHDLNEADTMPGENERYSLVGDVMKGLSISQPGISTSEKLILRIRKLIHLGYEWICILEVHNHSMGHL